MLHHRQVMAGELSLHVVEGGSTDDFLDSLKFARESPRPVMDAVTTDSTLQIGKDGLQCFRFRRGEG
jgi:hypothetical protein